MVRSQEFGFVIENILRTKVFDLPEKLNDTKQYDIPAEENKFDSTENISIKTSGSNTICLGDCLRIFNSETTLILIMYKQLDSKRKITEIIEVTLNQDFKRILFGSITELELKTLVSYIKAIPAGKASSETKKTYKKMASQLKGLIRINPKVDSKKQRRLQCSIPKIQKLLEQYPQFIRSRSQDTLRGIKIDDTYTCPKRIRKKKESNE
jgi:hypothetical protein